MRTTSVMINFVLHVQREVLHQNREYAFHEM